MSQVVQVTTGFTSTSVHLQPSAASSLKVSRPGLWLTASSASEQLAHSLRVHASVSEVQATTSATQPIEGALPCSVSSFRREGSVAAGCYEIQPLRKSDLNAAAVVLTRAFAGSPEGIPFDEVGAYCMEMLEAPPRGVLLTMRLFPNDPSLLPPNKDARLVGVAALSFTRDTREDFPSLQPPDEDAYLSNICTEALFRRQGYAKILLKACEELARAEGSRHLSLHARLSDEPAQQLYIASFGYGAVARDSFLAKLRGITPRALLRKRIQ